MQNSNLNDKFLNVMPTVLSSLQANVSNHYYTHFNSQNQNSKLSILQRLRGKLTLITMPKHNSAAPLSSSSWTILFISSTPWQQQHCYSRTKLRASDPSAYLYSICRVDFTLLMTKDRAFRSGSMTKFNQAFSK